MPADAPPPPLADPAAPAWARRAAGPLLLLGAALCLLAHVRIGGALIDDAYITYRYAANLAEGRGMLYNPAERVLGTTTPGWALLLAATGAVAGADAIPGAARVLGGLLLVATGLVAARLGRRLTDSSLVGALAGALVVLGPYGLVSGAAGMEAPLFNLLVAAALLGVFEGRWTLAAGTAGLTPVVRPEGALIVAVVGVAWALSLRPRRDPAAVPPGGAAKALAPLLLVAPGIVLLVAIRAWYGAFLPQSIVAKRAGIYPLSVRESAAETLRGLRGALTGATTLDEVAVTGIFLAGLAVGSAWLLRRSLRLWPLVAPLWGYLAFYATSRTIIFPHYLALVEPFALLAWGCALYAVVAWGMRQTTERMGAASTGGSPGPAVGGRRARAAAVAVVGAVLLVRPLALYPAASVVRGEPTAEDEVVGVPMLRLAYYRAAAEVLGPAIPAGTTVLMPEIGELGFRLRHVRVLDAAGLVSPAAVAFLPVPPVERVGNGIGVIPAGLVRTEEPELILTLELFARRSLYEDPWFAERYETVWLWDADDLVWGPLRVHALRGSEVGARLRGLPGGVTPTVDAAPAPEAATRPTAEVEPPAPAEPAAAVPDSAPRGGPGGSWTPAPRDPALFLPGLVQPVRFSNDRASHAGPGQQGPAGA